MPTQVGQRVTENQHLFHTCPLTSSSHSSHHSKEDDIDRSVHQLLAYLAPRGPDFQLEEITHGSITAKAKPDLTVASTSNLKSRPTSNSSHSQWKVKTPLWQMHQNWLGERRVTYDIITSEVPQTRNDKSYSQRRNKLLLLQNTLYNTRSSANVPDLSAKPTYKPTWKSVSFSDTVYVSPKESSTVNNASQSVTMEEEEDSDDDALFVDALEE
ncbi:hypothetical protein BDF14DRAFT_1741423 [Spinellus fusiger]|nr:hypothetical protein BDF14DRAFT_1741423 [Spinellus fusiger]